MVNPPIGGSSKLIHSLISVGKREIFVTETGEGPPLVMLHGGGPGASGLSNFGSNIDALAQNFRVIIPDLPGYGHSTKYIDQSDPFGDLAESMAGLLDKLSIPLAHFIGNSYGGAAALRLALEDPARVNRLLLMGPGGIGTTRALPTAGLRALLSYYTGSGPSREKMETFLRKYLVFNPDAITEDIISERFNASIDPEVVANPPLRRPSGPGALRTLAKMDLLRHPNISRLQTPTLVLWGAEDKVNRPRGGELLRRRLPVCDLYLVPQTGHWVQWEQPQLFNEMATSFLQGKR